MISEKFTHWKCSKDMLSEEGVEKGWLQRQKYKIKNLEEAVKRNIKKVEVDEF